MIPPGVPWIAFALAVAGTLCPLAPAHAALLLTLESPAPELAVGPFTPADLAEGFILLGEEPAGSDAFFGQGPPLVTVPSRLPVLDFRITVGGMDWTPDSGSFGILGFLDASRGIESMLFGATRADCGAAFSPCALDLVDLGTGGTFRLAVYRPADAAAGLPRTNLYTATGARFGQARQVPLPAPAPGTWWLLLGALAAAWVLRRTATGIGSA